MKVQYVRRVHKCNITGFCLFIISLFLLLSIEQIVRRQHLEFMYHDVGEPINCGETEQNAFCMWWTGAARRIAVTRLYAFI